MSSQSARAGDRGERRPQGAAEIAVGRIGAPHGVRGQVRVEPLTDSPQRLEQLREVCIELPGGERRQAVVEKAAARGSRVWMKIAGVDDRNAAQGLRGAYILIPRSQALELPAGHYFIEDIVGLEVVSVSGERLGKVREVIRTGANDIYATDLVMIPATREIVRKIDLDAGEMVVDLPEEV